MKPDILYTAEHEPNFIAMLEEHYTVHIPPDGSEAERKAFFASVASKIRALVLIAQYAPTREELLRLSSLENVFYLGAGYQNLDLETCREMGVTTGYSPGANAESMGDYALMMTLALVRGLYVADRFVRDGRWGPEFPSPMTETLFGKTVGLVGLGNAGMATAKRAEAFGTKVIYHKPTPRGDVSWEYFPNLIDMAAASDVMVVVCPGTPETHHLINGAVLDALGPKGYLVNIARGEVVEPTALIAALTEDRIAGAGLDVFEGEPGMPEALFGLDNVILSPHRAGVTRQAVRIQWGMAMESFAAHFAGKPLPKPIPGTE